jgi:hypothetical protein
MIFGWGVSHTPYAINHDTQVISGGRFVRAYAIRPYDKKCKRDLK